MKWFDRCTATRRKTAATAAALGVMATLSLPPFFLFPLVFVSSCGWMVLLQRATTARQAWWIGWWWGLGFFVSGLYWTSISLLVDAERFAWMIPFALLGLNGLIALFPAAASLGFYTLCRSASGAAAISRRPALAFLLFVVCWSLSEYARSNMLTGFPWNLIGYSTALWLPAMQAASLIGIHGLTMVIMLLSLMPLLYQQGQKQPAIRITFAVMLLFAWGMWRVDQPLPSAVEQPTVRLVQASIPQSLKWDPNQRIAGIREHINLTQRAGEGADIVIWPESAVPFAINKEPMLQRDLTSMIAPQQWLITGGLRLGEPAPEGTPRIYNSVYVMNAQGTQQVYDKHHLVPFGEFVPLRGILPIDKISPGDYDYSRGPGPQTLPALAGLPSLSPLVCYEAIFSNEAVGREQPRPQWLVNITNDAWFGQSSGPYQHLHMTRFRAVEQGLPLVRVANTGVSAVMDSSGRVVARMELNHIGTVDAVLPMSLPPTLYARIGDWGYVILLMLMCIITLGCVLQTRLNLR